MKRKDFLKNGALGMGAIIGFSSLVSSCKKDEDTGGDGSCEETPSETKGPFPIKTPAELVKENITSDRTGIPVIIAIEIQNVNNLCNPLPDVLVDVWHCDKDGYYSQYGGTREQAVDYTGVNFLRGRQTTDSSGIVRFISIYPGWYQGRAPHIHVEVLTAAAKSLLVTQIAFPEDISKTVYASELYKDHGQADTSNTGDSIFRDSLTDELATITGNLTDGYTISHIIKVEG